MDDKRVAIPVANQDTVSGVLSLPEGFVKGQGTGIILAHGAANDMEHPLIVAISQGLAEEGFLTLRFNFPYREKQQKAPDPQKTLVLTWQRVYEFLAGHRAHKPNRIIAAGKSMGGRVASQMVSDGLLPISGLIFLGYPLHAPGKKDKLRDTHLYNIKIPLLFFAGTRDPLCDLAKFRGVLERLEAPWHLETVEGGDHSFRLPKSSETSSQKVFDWIVDKTIRWLKTQGL